MPCDEQGILGKLQDSGVNHVPNNYGIKVNKTIENKSTFIVCTIELMLCRKPKRNTYLNALCLRSILLRHPLLTLYRRGGRTWLSHRYRYISMGCPAEVACSETSCFSFIGRFFGIRVESSYTLISLDGTAPPGRGLDETSGNEQQIYK